MIDFEIKGGIFDVDDTLLDNKPGVPGHGLHERSRIAAVHFVGDKYDIQALREITVQQNLDAFLNAPVHTLDAAVWGILTMVGIADSEVMNHDHPLLREIVALKNELHKDILLKFGEEVPGSTKFVRQFESKVPGKLAIASTAIRRDIELYLQKVGLTDLFAGDRIKSVESIEHPKPNPEIFNKAFDSLGLNESDRSSVCAFEDDPRGVMAAKAAGLYVCAITTRYSKSHFMGLEIPPDFAADSYEDMAVHLGVAA